MGTDIKSFVEVFDGAKWDVLPCSSQRIKNCNPFLDKYDSYRNTGGYLMPFYWRSYGLFGFLGCDSVNYSHVPSIHKERGLPHDASEYVKEALDDWYALSYLTVEELLSFDYSQVFWDRRVCKNGNGAALAEDGEGEYLTIRDFLGTSYFDVLNALSEIGNPSNVRVLFGFG